MRLMWESYQGYLRARSERFGFQRCALFWYLRSGQRTLDHSPCAFITADKPLLEPGTKVPFNTVEEAKVGAQRLEDAAVKAHNDKKAAAAEPKPEEGDGSSTTETIDAAPDTKPATIAPPRAAPPAPDRKPEPSAPVRKELPGESALREMAAKERDDAIRTAHEVYRIRIETLDWIESKKGPAAS